MRFYKPQKGGVELPALSNPASGSEILSGYQGINGTGGLVEGSHVCAGLDETTADATATAGDIMSGKTAYSQGQKVTGSHTCKTLAQMTTDATAGAGDIVSGKTAYANGQKVTGSHVCPTVADLTADADATAGDIAEGKTAYVDGKLITGTLVSKQGKFSTLSMKSVDVASKGSKGISSVPKNCVIEVSVTTAGVIVAYLLINNGVLSILYEHTMYKSSLDYTYSGTTLTITNTYSSDFNIGYIIHEVI